jgi:hypothetical protein
MRPKEVNMTDVKTFIEYLKTLPPETEVRVCCAKVVGYGTQVTFQDLEIDEYGGNIDFTDLTGNQFVKAGDPRENKKYLDIGLDEG